MSQTEYKAFGPGADLWIAPPLKRSRWTALIDWKCNFQISKSHFHEPKHWGREIQKIVEACGLNSSSSPRTSVSSSLLVPSFDFLPNRWLAIPPEGGDENSFLNESVKIIQGMGLAKVRVFLPKNISESKAQSFFKKQNLTHEIELISEESHA